MADLISTATVAKRLEVTEATLCHWRKRGVGPDHIRHGRVCFYPSDLLDEYLERIGPIPSREEDPERRFFADIHNPRMTPERKASLEDMLADLSERLAVVEVELASRVEVLEERLANAEKALVNLAAKVEGRKVRRIKRRRALARTGGRADG